MMNNVESVLYISKGFPHKEAPSHCPFIGYRLAYLRKKGIQADVLGLSNYKLKNSYSIKSVIIFLIISFCPLIRSDNYIFSGEKYRIFRIHYTFISRIWLPVILFVFKKIHNYSLLHFHFLWFAEELPWLKKATGIPSVITVHGSDMHKTAKNDLVARDRFKKIIAHADKVIYVSRGLRQIAENIGLSSERDTVIYNGYDPGVFHLTKHNPIMPVFGFVGHLLEVKRADKLPIIFRYIKNQLPQAKFIVVGGKSNGLIKEIYKEIEELNLIDDVQFTGEVDPLEVAEYYAKMDVLLFPSRNEGFGTVAIEARACGVPVVGSDNGGIPEAVGDTGKIVPEGEGFEKRFANAAVEIYKALPSRKQVHEGAREHSWNKIVRKEINLYEEVING